jgi:DNA-binding transcriptional regulator PaaX
MDTLPAPNRVETTVAADLARVAEGTRTPDHRDHNPGLYQLSYRHRARHRIAAKRVWHTDRWAP